MPKRSTKKNKAVNTGKNSGNSQYPYITITPNSWISTSNQNSFIGTNTNNFTLPNNINNLTRLPHLLDLRSYLFKIVIGDYDEALVTSLISSIQFDSDYILMSFYLDDKNTIREAFSEYHFFRISYLDSKGNDVEVYEIKTDPLVEIKYILPDIRHDKPDIPLWKLVLSPYTCTKI